MLRSSGCCCSVSSLWHFRSRIPMRFASTVGFFYWKVHKSVCTSNSHRHIQHPNRYCCYCPLVLLDENCPSFGKQIVDSYRSLRLSNCVRAICHMYQSVFVLPRSQAKELTIILDEQRSCRHDPQSYHLEAFLLLFASQQTLVRRYANCCE